jgi:hypothetical protein
MPSVSVKFRFPGKTSGNRGKCPLVDFEPPAGRFAQMNRLIIGVFDR